MARRGKARPNLRKEDLMAKKQPQRPAGTEEEVRARVVAIANSGLNTIDQFFKGEETKPEKLSMAFKMLTQATKVLQMNQVRVLTERSQMLRLLPWLPTPESRARYIKLTNPKAAPLLLQRPKVNPAQ